jgi:predicted permease
MDVRFVLRSLWKSRGYVATAVTVLACTVAANATVYSYVKGTLLADTSFPDPERVALVWGRNLEDGQRRDVISGPNAVDVRERLTTARAAAFHYDGTYLEVDGHPEVVSSLDVSWDFFEVLGVSPAQGRGFGESERHASAGDVIVVSHGFWRDYMSARPDAVGSTLLLEEQPHTVVGVLAPDFEFLAPAPVMRVVTDDELAARERVSIHFNMIARLQSDATFEQLDLELARIARDIEAEYAFFEGWDFHAEPLQPTVVEAVRPALMLLVATVLLVLVVALVNLAMLFRVRTAVRGDEIGMRAALGAGRARLARVLAIEPMLLAAAGAALGLAVTPWILARMVDLVPAWIPIPDSAAMVPAVRSALEPGVAVVAFATAVVGALLLTAPAFLPLVRRGFARSGRSGRVRSGLGGLRALIGIELALTTVLCVSGGLLVRSLDGMLETPVGVEPDGLLAVRFADVWGAPIEEQAAYFRQVVDAVEAVPGVRRAGVIDYLDFLAEDDFARIYFLDRSLQPERDAREEWRRVDDGAFDAAGMRIVQGRGFEREDIEGTVRTAIVNEAFARKHWPEGEAIGQLVSTHDAFYRDMRIVGVVADVRSLGPTNPAPPTLYVPQQGNPRGTVGLYVRAEADDVIGIAPAVREAIWSVDPAQPVIDLVPMRSMVDRWTAVPAAARTLVVALAALAWGLSIVGVFGVAAYAVRSRRAELGIRVALGATPARLEADHLLRLAPVILLGVGAGVIGAVTMAWTARALLFGVGPLDPISLLVAVVATGGAGVLATWWPARAVRRVEVRDVLS